MSVEVSARLLADPWMPAATRLTQLAVPGRLAVLEAVQTRVAATVDELMADTGFHSAAACHHVRVLFLGQYLAAELIDGQMRYCLTRLGREALCFASRLKS